MDMESVGMGAMQCHRCRSETFFFQVQAVFSHAIPDGHAVYAKELGCGAKVFTERAVRYQIIHVLIGGRDAPGIDTNLPTIPEPLDMPGFQRPQ